MDKRNIFCCFLNIFVFIFYLYIETVILPKIFTNGVFTFISSLISTGVLLLYYVEMTSCRIYSLFYKDEKNDLIILKNMNIIDKTFICEIYIAIGVLLAPAYFGKLVINSIIADENWKMFIAIVYSIIIVIFAIGVSAKICDKIKKINKKN